MVNSVLDFVTFSALCGDTKYSTRLCCPERSRIALFAVPTLNAPIVFYSRI